MNDDFDVDRDDDLADDLDLPLLADAAAFAGRYAPGVLPGNDPLELLTGLYLGLTDAQLDAVGADDRLHDLIRGHWDDQGVDATYRAAAARDDELGRRHAALLRSCGYGTESEEDLADLVEQAIWLVLATAPQAKATKGDEVPDTSRWTLRDSRLDCDLVVTEVEDAYEVAFVPEVDVPDTAQVVARWADDSIEARPVTLVARQLAKVRFAARGRRLDAVTVVWPGDDAA